MGAIRSRLASVALFACLGLSAGCGDDTPAHSDGGGGAGGQAGMGGSGGGSGTGGAAGETGEGGEGGGGTAGGGSGGGGTAGGGSGGSGTAGGGSGGTASGGRGGSGGTAAAGTSGGGSGGSGTAGGGSAGTAAGGSGGSAVGGTAGGGTAGGGGSGGSTLPPCYTVAFTAPTSGATLTVADDKTSTCADGFQYDVKITTNAPDATDVSLYSGSSPLQTVQVSGGAATFSVTLPTGANALQIQFPSTSACTDPSTANTVTVSCSTTAPTCSVSQPTISDTHPALNGVQAPTGDRTSSAGSPYQATFVVTTNAEDGQPVSLKVTSESTNTPSTMNLVVAAGAASGGVALVPDGTYDVVATCTNKNGISTTTTLAKFPVDTTPPDLTVSSPSDGQFFAPSQLSNGAFQVCGQTTATDAANLPSTLGPAAQNFCVSLGTSTQCTPVLLAGASTCVGITCPGGAPFNLTVTLTDAAGNPTSKTISGVSCASTLPSVQIVSPASDAPTFGDVSKRVLSATAPAGIKDLDGSTAGAQANVVACTDTSGTAALLAGHVGDATLSQITTTSTVAAVAGDNCPAGLGFAAHFSGVTLPESTEGATGALSAATRLAVTVTSGTQPITGTSPSVDLWVDSVAPSIGLSSPPDLCASFQQAAGDVTQSVVFTADDALVTLQVTNAGSTTTYTNPTFASNVATFSSVVFKQGQNDVTAAVADPAGNATAFATSPCPVTIGTAPVVTFTTPTSANVLCPTGSTANGCIPDGDSATTGWQGSIVVRVTVKGQLLTSGNVTFSVGGTTLGTGALDANGDATVTGITLPEGAATITATTDNVPGAGVGSATVTVTVDLSPPNAPTNLTALVLDRRATSMQLTWTAPSDIAGGPVNGYQVRYAKVPITTANFNDSTVTTTVNYTGTPASPGQLDGIAVTGLYIESGYYFAVEASDGAGNRSTIAATSSAVTAHFNVTTLTGTTGSSTEGAGIAIDGSGDANGDGVSDILMGSSNGGRAYLFFGAVGGLATTPSVVFSSTAGSFGRGAAYIGDIDADGREDIAIAATSINQLFVYKGRASWPMTLADTDADYVITTDTSYASSSFGSAIARLGDFNGDLIDDFAVGAPNFGGAGNFKGRVNIILGSASFASVALPSSTRSIEVDSDPALATPFFGTRVVGLGHFYPGSTGTLVVSAPGITSGSITSNNEGHIYAFRGQTGTNGVIAATAADAVIAGATKGMRIGAVLANLGPITGALPVVGSGNTSDTTGPGGSGSLFVLSGTTATGPFANNQAFYYTGSGVIGACVIGGGISGRDGTYSLIGSGTPDLMVLGRNGTDFGLVDGSKLSGLGSPVDGHAVADVIVAFPSGFSAPLIGGSSLIPDINGDGVPDFALSNAASNNAGKVVVFW